ncbi:ATP-binding protein [Streptomyces sp. LX-29]|uniref:ATP-binding protein n=1 Tax=Streptomyces sp. LX-29 TaxID=2900152 RepID=UPI00240E442E|nr:ATP-binding protein [Streptomyces sp. LX-29]WFB06662.1 ATP-binding protein [Streptomyces sp. LX-29]
MAPSHEALRLGHSGGGSLARCLQDAFSLPALSTSVAEARRRVLARLREWGIGEEVRDNAELIVSELFTNAVRHTSSERVCCEVRAVGPRLRLEVTDQGCARTEPMARPVTVDQEGGRGLMLVEALSDSWGVRPAEGGRGRAVWAHLS